MASRRFINARRLKFINTSGEIEGKGSIEIKPTTSLILHPTTDLVASPEGSFIIRTTASFDSDVTVCGNLNILGSLIVTGSAIHHGDNIFGDAPTDYHTFWGAILASGNISARGNASIEGDLWTKGNASIDGTLDVSGNTVLNASAHIKNNASLDGNLAVAGALWNKGNASLDGTLDVSGNAVLNASVHVKNNASLDGTLSVAGALWNKGNASLDGTLDVSGAVTHLSSLWNKGNASLDGTLDVNGNAVLNASLHTKGNASIDGKMTVVGNSNFQNASVEERFEMLGGGNAVMRRKVTVNYSDFSAAAAVESYKLYLASMGDTIIDITAKLVTKFKYNIAPATVLGSIYKVSVGDMSNLFGYNASTLCGSSVTTPSILFATQTGLGGKGAYLWNASGCRISKVLTANASIEANFNASGGTFLASLTQGKINFYIDSIQNP